MSPCRPAAGIPGRPSLPALCRTSWRALPAHSAVCSQHAGHFIASRPAACRKKEKSAVGRGQAVKQAYLDGHELALILEDDMSVLDGRWPMPALPRSAPADWDILLLYMLGEVANELYRCKVLHVHGSSMQLCHAVL